MRFLNRTEELKRLNRALKLNRSSFIVIYGRRRIGKTRLLLEWIKKTRGIYWVADESASAVQRSYFSKALDKVFPGFSEVVYPDWYSLFQRLAREAKAAQWRGPLIIDELPYLILAAPEFSSILQKFVDHEAKDAGLTIAVSGSSQRMMQDAVLSQSAPLYGRANESIQLNPLEPKYISNALGIDEPEAGIEAYSVFGGIPLYWEMAKDVGGSLEEIAEHLILDPSGPLHNEPARLLHQEIPSAVSLRPILDAIGQGANRLSEVAGRLQQPATSLPRPLLRLQELGLVDRETPFGSSKKESKRALYKIGDPFLRFWFSAVAPHRSSLAQLTVPQRMAWFKRVLPRLVSVTWESMCRYYVPRLSGRLGAQYGSAGRYWHGQGPEWDVVAKEFEGEGLLIGESKWIVKEPTLKFIEEIGRRLIEKGAPPIKRKSEKPSTFVLFINKKPKGKVPLIGNLKIIDASDILRS